MNNVVEVVDYLVEEGIISEEVGEIALKSDTGMSYENILTNESSEPTEFLEGLVKLTGYTIEVDDTDGSFYLKKL